MCGNGGGGTGGGGTGGGGVFRFLVQYRYVRPVRRTVRTIAIIEYGVQRICHY